MALYSSETCMESHRVRFVLAEKGINVDIVNITQDDSATEDRELDQPLEVCVEVRCVRQFDREDDRSVAVDSYRGDVGTGSAGCGALAEGRAAVGRGVFIVRDVVVPAAGGGDQGENQE